MDSQTAITVICRPSGDVVEVLHDDLGLGACFGPGTSLKSIVEPDSAVAAQRLLREIRENGVAFDVKVQIQCQGMGISLLLSGYRSDGAIHLIGAMQPLSRENLVHAFAKHLSPQKESTLTHTALLALTAHDLRNHLNGILAASQYLLDDAAEHLEPEHVTMLRSIESSGRDMFRVIDDVMQVAMLESTTRTLELKRTDIVALVRKSVSANRSRAERKNVRLGLTPATAVPFIAADPARIDRMIDRLLASVIDSAPGGMIEFSFAMGDQQTLVLVRVEGSNISGEQLRSILNVSHPSIEGVKARTVLAFRVMKRIVEELGGSIDVDSATSKELTITLALPMWGEVPVRSHRA
jgi:signal transduction histidine kinase